MTTKEKVAELVARLREISKQQDPIAKTAIELVKLIGDDLKESLVTADGEDMLRRQGAAREFAKLYRNLTTEPPQSTTPGAQI